MKILAVAVKIPTISKSGDQTLSFHRLSYLAKFNTIELICFGNHNDIYDAESVEKLVAIGIRVHLIKQKYPEILINLIFAIPNKNLPFQCAINNSSDFKDKFNEINDYFEPDSIYCVLVRIFLNINFKGPIYTDMIDSLGLNFSRRIANSKWPINCLLRLEAKRVSIFERKIALRSSRAIVVSKIDKKFIGVDSVDVIPLGIDIDKFINQEKKVVDPIITFTGNMYYQPNVDAVIWFVNNCWQDIKIKIPGIRFVIAGNRPQSIIMALSKKDDSIIVLGSVPSIANILNNSSVAIAPMQSGSGMQFKILEAMSCGIPVVTTSLGIGDISAIPNQDILIADSADDFTRLLISLIENESLNISVGKNGLKYVTKNHSWDIINKQFALTCGLDFIKCVD